LFRRMRKEFARGNTSVRVVW